jgi:hypothetical protein
LHSPFALAAPPKLELLFPAGAPRGATTTITASDAAAWPVRIWIDRADGVAIEAQKDKGKLTVTATADALPGVRWLRLYNDDGASTLRPFIIGTLPEIEEKPAAAAPQDVTAPVVINGRLEKSGDVDVFRVKLSKGQTLIASTTANNVFAAPMDGVLQVCNADGFVLTQNDDARGLDPQIIYTVPRDGDYLVRTFAFPAAPDSTINFAGGGGYIYRLTITTGPFLDHTLPLAVPVVASQNSPLTPHGWNLPADLSKPSLALDADRDIATLFHPLLANTIELPQASAALAVADAGSTITKPQPVPVPTVISGRLEAVRAKHAFRFTVSKGKAVRLRVESQSLGFPIDPVLTIFDAAGKQLNQTDDAAKQRDPSLTFTPPADGDHIVTVRDLHGRGGFRFVYRLSIEPVAPDFAATLERDTFNANPAAPLEIPVTLERRDGFDGEVSVTIEGLPEGAVAPTVISKNKDATAKAVKLIVTSPTGPWSGPVRIVAQSGAIRRGATFATLGVARHNVAWLTVGRPAAPPK